MTGIYLNENSAKNSIQNWSNKIIASKGGWEGNNLHLDEIEGLFSVRRSEWIEVSFMLINVLPKQFKLLDSLILFLHIDLKYSIERQSLGNLSLNWLKENVSEYTPPSLNLTSLEYAHDYYSKELVACQVDNSILERIHTPLDFGFFYRTYFDKDEDAFSRELYIFIQRV